MTEHYRKVARVESPVSQDHGFGRSARRENLRRFFEIDAELTTVATLYALAQKGQISKESRGEACDEDGHKVLTVAIGESSREQLRRFPCETRSCRLILQFTVEQQVSSSGFQKLNRKIHIYAGMFSLLFIVFFGLSGFMLNHRWKLWDWFSRRVETTREVTVQIPAEGSDLQKARAILKQLDVDGEIHRIVSQPSHSLR